MTFDQYADEPWALERLEAVLKPIMWRNDKISVGDELKLPPRTLDVSLLRSCMLHPPLTLLALPIWLSNSQRHALLLCTD